MSSPNAEPRAGFLSEWWSKLTQPGPGTIDDSFPFDVCYRHKRTAKRYIITVRPDGTVAVTIPRRGTQREAERFVRSRLGWIETTLSRLRQRPVSARTWLAGTEILFRGDRVPLRVVERFGGWCVDLPGESIPVANPGGDLRAPVENHLRSLAEAELSARLMELARLHGCRVQKVVIRDQRTRWGSCSRRGTVSLNWRLVQLPEKVRDYILLHELMHLREMNHSERFWREVRAVCPDYAEAEAWLKRQGSILGC